MALGLLIIAAIPTTVGVCEALSQQKKVNNSEKEKAKFHLTTNVTLDDGRQVECWCVLKEGKLWVDHPEAPVQGHKFTGYYFTYPSEAQHLGLVSTIADDPPMLNWIFVDKDSHMLRHGGRQATLGGHTIGPWGWSDNEQCLTLRGDEQNFVAVEQNHRWAFFFEPEHHNRGSHIDNMNTNREGQINEYKCPQKGPHVIEDKGQSAGLEGWEDGSSTGRWVDEPRLMTVKLYRKMVFGMEIRYVKEGDGKK